MTSIQLVGRPRPAARRAARLLGAVLPFGAVLPLLAPSPAAAESDPAAAALSVDPAAAALSTHPAAAALSADSATVSAATAGADASEPLTVQRCVEIALERSAQIEEAEAKVDEYKGRLAEVESVFYPKLSGLAFLAPMFTGQLTNDSDIFSYQRRWRSPKDWGPYTHVEALLAQPLYTFGRAAAGEEAARERMAVEQARVHETELTVALEVRKLYYLRLFALSMMPSLRSTADTVKTARKKAQEKYDAGTGEVTQADIAKLDYAATQVERYLLEAKDGAQLALAALKHTMGLSDSTPLVLADDRLPDVTDEEIQSLEHYVELAATQRPEWAQLTHGKKAAAALERAEKLSLAPVLFFGGTFEHDWAPTRESFDNTYLYDPYNQITGGIAIGLQFNLDPALAMAKARTARALGAQVSAMQRFADTGIPLRVRKARDDVLRDRQEVAIAERGMTAARKWMLFAAAAYGTGTGEARDLLEGVAAYMSSKRDYYQALQAYHVARAELTFAVGGP